MNLLRISDVAWVNLDLVTDIVIASPNAVKFYIAVIGTDGEQQWSTATGHWADKVIVWLSQQPDPPRTGKGTR